MGKSGLIPAHTVKQEFGLIMTERDELMIIAGLFLDGAESSQSRCLGYKE